MLPNAIVIGAQKCATTSLHWYLDEHPEISVARRKPLGFFVSKQDRTHGNLPMNWERGADWYAAACPDEGKIRLESSPDYTNFPHYRGVPERMKSVVPDAKLVYIVRNPLDRLVSHWMHNYTGNLEDRSIEEIFRAAPGSSYVTRGLYGMQLEQYPPHFDLDRVAIITTEGLRHDRRETLAAVFRFLGVDDGFWSESYRVVRHRSADKRRNNRVGMAIDRLFGRHVLDRLHGRQRYLFRKLVYTPFSSPVPRPQLDAGLRQQLAAIYEPDLARLAGLTGQPFTRLLDGSKEAEWPRHVPL